MDEENAPVPGTSGRKANAAKKTGKALESAETSEKTKSNKTTLDLVCEAIEVLGESRKGASAQSIRKYVQSKKEYGTDKVNALVSKALVKGLEKEILSRPSNKKDAVGATGFFVLAKKVDKPKSTKKLTKEHSSEQHASNSKTAEEPTTKNKRAANSKDPKGTKKAPVKKRSTSDRRDASDTEIVVKKKVRKSMKSYSSDTDVDLVQKNEIEKSRNKTKAVKSNAEKSEPPSKAVKPKGTKKLYNSSENEVEKEKINIKPRKTKGKKET